jgi:arylsulfatase
VEGALLAQGGRHNGFAFYLLDGHLHHVFNYVGLELLAVRAPEPVTAGRHTLRYEFQPTGPAVDLFSGKGVPARSKLYVDGALVAVAELPYTLVSSLSFYGMTCGYNAPDSVVPAQWTSPFTCTASIDHVTLDVTGELTEDAETDLVEVLARQ